MNSIPDKDDKDDKRDILALDAQQKHKKPAFDAGKVAALDIAQSFGKLIEAAPEVDGSGGYDSDAPEANLVRNSHGWDERYIQKVELRGEEWAETFLDAKSAVASRGLVALLGRRGTGKTRMAAEITRAGYWPNDKGEGNGNASVKGKTSLYRRAMDIFLQLRAAHKPQNPSEMEILDRLSRCGLLVIDEFQERGETPFEDRIITSLLDRRYSEQRPTILIANLSREELAKMLSPSVRDRMHENGRSFEFNWNSYRRPKP